MPSPLLRRLAALLILSSCAPAPPAALTGLPLAPVALSPQPAPAPVLASGAITSGTLPPRAAASYGTPATGAALAAAPAGQTEGGQFTLNFADTDLRAAVSQVLGTMLHVNYTIDPSVSGTATLQTTTPLDRSQLIPVLQTLLAQNNAVLVQADGLYRVMPAGQGGGAAADTEVLPLRYADATELATVLQPYVAKGGALAASSQGNAIVIQGDPASRAALASLVQAFDIDALAGQSYELFPVNTGDAKDFASAFSAALVKQTGSRSAAAVSVVPLERISAVLVIANAPSYLSDAARIYAVLNRDQLETMRSWHIYYLRNSRANDAAYLLQEAFTPQSITAQPTADATQTDTTGFNQDSSGSGTGSSSGGTGGDATGSSGNNGSSGSTGSSDTGGLDTGSANSPAPGTAGANGNGGASANTGSASALLGPLTAGSADTDADSMRILADLQNNAVLVYATADENDQVEAMLSKIDIEPLQVRIDATIAEVDLTGALQYGTQFYFKSGGINAVLSESTSTALETSFPGFVLSGHGSDAAPLAISALQSVTKVRVLSSPELMVLDNQAASLKVGDSVPYLSQTSQSTLTSDAQIIQSINYRDTGVIMRVTPHIGDDGLVTMDISQEVSAVSPTQTTTGIDSPTFTERTVSSRVAIQDGQTIGLAGLISDDDSRQNQGFPGLKNVPLLGALFGSQNNNRVREELLVLITPHVIRSQQQALDLTEDLQEALPNAALVPGSLQSEPFEGSEDPSQAVRAKLEQ
jgi:general secretion pathway protein D